MKHSKSIIFSTAAVVLLAAMPVKAETTQVTGVKLSPSQDGVKVLLQTVAGDRPQVFTTKRGNALISDIINTKLSLPGGNNYRQDNPAPGIASVVITSLDANSIRMTVTGTGTAPTSQPAVRNTDGISISLSAASGTQTGQVPQAQPVTPTPPIANNPAPIPPQLSPKPDVLVPNPQITIDGKPAPAIGPGQPASAAPPFLPRAVAPPVGDIAVSNTDASPPVIDLGTNERVPRLVLRDAPVREVLSLLARAANLNLAYSGGAAGEKPEGGAAGADGPTISLDIENEPVQDVFNYVLRLSGLEANRSGRTIFVGSKLPNATRDSAVRNMRLNQVSVGVALNFLVGLGAESAVSQERQVTTVSAVPISNGSGGSSATAVTNTETSTQLKLQQLRVDFKDSTPILRGLQALGDERTNSVTLIGSPRLIEIASAQLVQLDIRRRQVAVNVKILDVNLAASEDFKNSFSFGLGNNFFVNDGGAAALNFGGVNPPTAAATTGGLLSPTVINNPFTAAPFVDPNSSVGIPGTVPGTIIVDANGNSGRTLNPGTGQFYQPIAPFGSNGNPLTPGYSNITPATDNVVTIGSDGKVSVARGTLGTATTSLPSLYQYPKRFLSSLQAQVTNGNAKILTDPTLIVQEGQAAQVNLTQEVIGNLKRDITRDAGGSRETITAEKINVGLTLSVKIDRIDDNGFVSLSVAPSVKAPAGQENLANSGRIILVNERSIQSGLIRLRDGQTLILSGIIQDSDRSTVTKIPILGDLPLIGSLFRSTNRQNERREVIVLLTPQVLDDSERSSFGYNYKPSPEVRQMLERRGLNLAPKK